MEKSDVFSFEDFMNKGITPVKESKKEEEKVDDKVTNVTEPIKDKELSEPKKKEEKPVETEKVMPVEVEDFVIDEDDNSAFVESTDNDDFYKLYRDINEEFSCDIAIEGSSPEDTYARIIVESEEWSLVFPGTIRNGKCIVPIKKLGILKEGEIGNIKLEVVAEGNLFIPWEDTFKVKVSKKVTVNLNETKTTQKAPQTRKVGVKVNVNR
jgi:hypothetical protein